MAWIVFNCCPCMPHRFYVCILSFLGLTINYIMRFSFSITLTEMTEAPPQPVDPDACPAMKKSWNKTKTKKEFTWSELQQGLCHSSFFWGYIVTLIPGGVVSERFGAKIILVIFVGLTCLLCGLTPFIVRYLGLVALIIDRVSIGLCQGFVYAALHIVVAKWVPKQERGLWGTIVFSGAHAGNTCSNFFSGYILHWFPGKWEIVFYTWAIIGVAWTIAFALTTYGFPSDHPNMKPKEKAILDAYLAQVGGKKVSKRTPWVAILTSWPVWVMVIAMFGHCWGLFALVTVVPKFMKAVLHFNVKDNGMINASIYLAMWVFGLIGGVIVDWIERKKLMSTNNNRKVFTTISSVGPSVGLILAVYSGCNIYIAVGSLIAGMGMMGFFYPSLKVNPLDLSVNYAGTLGALAHAVGAISGILVPQIVGVITTRGYLSEWRIVMWIAFIVMSVTNIIYIFWAKSDLQPWNTPREDDEPKAPPPPPRQPT